MTMPNNGARVFVKPTGAPLPANHPEFTALDRYTMTELWARAVPHEYARLLRSPIHTAGQDPLPAGRKLKQPA